jgi:hypothetical protein
MLGAVDGWRHSLGREAYRITDGDAPRRERPADGAGPPAEGIAGAGADDVVEQLAGRGDADDLEVDIADAESFAGGGGHVAVGDGDVASGSARLDGAAEILGGGVERGLGLDGDVPVLGAVVAVTDDAKAGFDPHGLDGAHGEPAGRGDMDGRDHRRRLAAGGPVAGHDSARSRESDAEFMQ